ncbi:MAG: histidine phosphotransferase family protein [Pseudomonadota bacterium]
MKAYNNPDQLASLITSRICHDLANPVGAIHNGLELLELSGFPTTPELELVIASVKNAQSKIGFFRAAFGPEDRAAVSVSEIQTLLKQKSHDGKTVFDWAGEIAPERSVLKSLLLLCLCIESSLPRGGNVRIRHFEPGWVIEAQAERIDPHNELWAHIKGSRIDHLEAADIHFELLRQTVFKNAYSLEWSFEPNALRITLLA